MHFTLREKFLIMLFCISMVVGISGSVFGDIFSRNRSIMHLDMFCKENAQELDDIFTDVSVRVDTIAYETENSLSRTYDPTYKLFIDKINSSSDVLLRQVLEKIEGHSFTYLKYSYELLGNEGIFLEKNGKEIYSLQLTDLSKYEKDDIEHVGWYYLPVEYGAPVWLEPYHNENVDTYMISYVYPIYYNGEFFCLYGVDLDLNELLLKVRGMKVNDSGYSILYDKAGNPLGKIPPEVEGHQDEFVTASEKLKNGMTLTAYVPKDEIYAMRKSPAYRASSVVYTLLLICFFFFVLMSIGSKETDEQVDKKRSWRFVVGVGIVVILLIQGVLLVIMKGGIGSDNAVSIEQKGGYNTDYKAVSLADREPYSYIETGGRADGYFPEVANALANDVMANIDVGVVEKRIALNMVKNGEADIIMGLDSGTAKDNPELIYTDPIVSDYVCIYGKRQVDGIMDILKSNVAYVAGDEYPDVYGILENASEYPTYNAAFAAVANDTCDFLVGLKPPADLVLKDARYSSIKEVYVLVESQMCMAVNKDHEMLARSLNAAIADIQTEDILTQLHAKWLENRNVRRTLPEIIKEHSLFYEITTLILVILIIIYQVLILRAREDKMFLLSETDSLTGIYNRRGGERRIRQLLRQRTPGVFILMDVDKFKTINDTFGHLVGDKVLTAIGECLKQTFRNEDVCMRLGGDEYVVYIAGITQESNSRDIINRFFNELQAIDIPEITDRQISVSAGAVLWSGEKETDFLSLYALADKGTYESKNHVGNFVIFIQEE